jgi:hypothetical protein
MFPGEHQCVLSIQRNVPRGTLYKTEKCSTGNIRTDGILNGTSLFGYLKYKLCDTKTTNDAGRSI